MSPVFDMFLTDDSIVSSEHLGGPDGDLRLVPDLDRLTVLSAQPGWAWAPVDRLTQDGPPYPVCQRTFARRMTQRAAEAGIGLRAAVEIEWAVGRGDAPDGQFVPACTGPGYGMTRLVELSDYAADLLAALDEQGVEVDQIHPEYFRRPVRAVGRRARPVAAADRSVLVRQTIRAVSQRHGLRASFAPSVVRNGRQRRARAHLGLAGRLEPVRRRRSPVRHDTGRRGLAAGILDALPRCARSGRPARRATCGWSPRTGPARSPAGAGRPGRAGCAWSRGWSAARSRRRTSR
jgi:glutamine synthetase